MNQQAIATDELLQRIDIILNQLKADIEENNTRLPVSAANCLRGAVIRLAQAYNHPEVSAKIDDLVSLTLAITGA